MRLIDADALMESFKHLYEIDKDVLRSIWVLNSLIEVIEEQPTAYDVDKVVEQLKLPKRNALVLCTANRGNLLEHIGMNTISNYENAIRIVKGGGVDE